MNSKSHPLVGKQVTVNKPIYQFGRVIKSGEKAVIYSYYQEEGCFPLINIKTENGDKFSVDLSEITIHD